VLTTGKVELAMMIGWSGRKGGRTPPMTLSAPCEYIPESCSSLVKGMLKCFPMKAHAFASARYSVDCRSAIGGAGTLSLTKHCSLFDGKSGHFLPSSSSQYLSLSKNSSQSNTNSKARRSHPYRPHDVPYNMRI
jgi:hypothetical protein